MSKHAVQQTGNNKSNDSFFFIYFYFHSHPDRSRPKKKVDQKSEPALFFVPTLLVFFFPVSPKKQRLMLDSNSIVCSMYVDKIRYRLKDCIAEKPACLLSAIDNTLLYSH